MASRHRTLRNTPVRESVHCAAESLEHITVDTEAISALADRWAQDEFELPAWRAPVFPDERDGTATVEEVIDFLLVGNSVNFAFRDFETGEKFTVEYDGIGWEGAFGMWASFKRAFDANPTVLSGEYLAALTLSDVEELFRPADGTSIPLLRERHEILVNIGEVLVEQYDGHFHTLFREAPPRLYGEDGIVTQLVREFDAFQDAAKLDGNTVRFDKRSQLAAGMVYDRFSGTEPLDLTDPGEFTVFADYNLPNILRSLGILEYSDPLQQRIDQGDVLSAGSREEVELRVATIAAADGLIERVNQSRDADDHIYGPHMDYKLFSQRDQVTTPVHKCRTTAY